MSTDSKVIQIFEELAGSRAEELRGIRFPTDSYSKIVEGILSEEGNLSEEDIVTAHNIGFNLLDWQSDAAFLVALVLFPERFTNEEVAEGVRAFLIHAPAHVVEAARLGGYSTEDFEE